jgi:UDP-N-acetylglucosamine acyltransferase
MNNIPQTNIHPQAKIGKNVKIEPFATIYEDVEIGDNCWIASNAVIMNGARIGNNCKIFPGAVVSAESQDLKYKGEYAVTEIGENTTIREYVTIHKGTSDKNTTKVGSNCLLMSYVHVAHDCIVGDNVVIANLVQLAGHVIIGDWVIIEGTAAIQEVKVIIIILLFEYSPIRYKLFL